MQKKRSDNKAAASYQDYITNKILISVTLALVGVGGLMMLHRRFTNAQTFLSAYNAMLVLLAVGAVMTVAGALWWGVQSKKGQDTRGHYFIGQHLFVLGAVVLVSMGFLYLMIRYFFAYTTAIQYLYAALPVMAILYLFYHSYSREFFVISLFCVIDASLIWLMRQLLEELNWNHGLVFAAAAVLALVGGVLLVLSARKNHGCLGQRRLFDEGAGYGKVLLAMAITAATVVAAFVLGPVAAYYLLFVVVGLWFVGVVYYTVKLM